MPFDIYISADEVEPFPELESVDELYIADETGVELIVFSVTPQTKHDLFVSADGVENLDLRTDVVAVDQTADDIVTIFANEPLTGDISNPAAYQITSVGSGVAANVVSVISATSTKIMLEVSLLTRREAYLVKFGAISTVAGRSLLDEYVSFLAEVSKPTFTVAHLDNKNIQINFSRDFTDDSELVNLDNYAMEKGLTPTVIQKIDPDSIRVTVAEEIFGVTQYYVAVNPVWKVWMKEFSNPFYPDGVDKRIYMLSKNGLLIVLGEYACWTFDTVSLNGTPIVQNNGWNGSVVYDYALSEWYGTGHGNEFVTSYQLEIDGVPHQYEEGATFFGDVVVSRKTSDMGPYQHVAVITMSDDGRQIIEEHSYTAIGDTSHIDPFYSHMHVTSNAFNKYWAGYVNGEEIFGQTILDTGAIHSLLASLRIRQWCASGGVDFKISSYSGVASIVDRLIDNKKYIEPDAVLAGTSTFIVTMRPFLR